MFLFHDVKDPSSSPGLSEPPGPAGFQERAQSIEAQQVRLLYTQAPIGLVASVLNAGIVAFVLWNAVAHPVLIGWFTLIVVVTLSRFMLVRMYRRAAPTADCIHLWRTRFIAGVAAASVVWGAAGIVLFPPESIAHQVFLVFILGGMAAGAIATLSSVMPAFLVFFLPTLLPVTLRLLLQQGDWVLTAMGFLLLSFAGVLFITARHLHTSIAESLSLRLENLDLIHSLSVGKEQTEHANQQLAESNQALSAAMAEVRASEERFRSLSAASPIGVFQTDAEGRCLYTNARWQEIAGLAPEESLGDGWNRSIHPEDCDGVLAEWLTSTRAGREFSCEFRMLTPKGESRWVHSRAAALRADSGALLGHVGTVEDITERRAVELMKDEFVSVVSHELRTPLTSIHGALGLLAGGLLGPLPEKGQRLLDIAVNNTNHLVRLVNDILDVERMKSGKITMQKQVCDAAALMTQAADEMRVVAEKARITLAISPQSAQVWADPDRIVQTLTNLLSNAIKFSLPGAAVRLSTENQGDQILFQVKDQGWGIPADKLESIFGRFQQVDSSDSRKKGGTGLGLTICRNIIQQHGGRIWVESTLGKGSTFFFTLPALPR